MQCVSKGPQYLPQSFSHSQFLIEPDKVQWVLKLYSGISEPIQCWLKAIQKSEETIELIFFQYFFSLSAELVD